MKITIESTEKMANVRGAPARVWTGMTEQGIRCFVFVSLIAVRGDQDSTEFDRDLFAQPVPHSVLELVREQDQQDQRPISAGGEAGV